MSLPDFIGIGAMKAGTTSLHALLSRHPGILMPVFRKEVMFFDQHWERGLDWYGEHFAHVVGKKTGEICPNYLFDPDVPERIAEVIPDVRLIVLLRNPVERAYSQFKHFVRERRYQSDFDSFLAEYPNVIKRGFYHEQIQRYLNHFDREQLQIVLFEEFVADPVHEIVPIFEHIGVDAHWKAHASDARQHSAATARFPRLQSVGRRGALWLYDHDMPWVISALKSTPLRRLLLRPEGQNNSFEPIHESTRSRLRETYSADIEAMSSLLDRDLESIWRREPG